METTSTDIQENKLEAAFEIARAFIYGDAWDPDAAAWCRRCESRVPMVTPAVAAALEKVSLDRIFERMEKAELHYRTSPMGAISICLCSLIEGNGESRSTVDQNRKARPAKTFVRLTSAVVETSANR